MAAHGESVSVRERVNDLLGMNGHSSVDHNSRATSPGGGRTIRGDEDEDAEVARLGRTRPRVFPYARYMPYETETRDKREADLDEMIKHLYVAVAAGDFVPGAVHWTCLLYTSPSPRDGLLSRMPSSA